MTKAAALAWSYVAQPAFYSHVLRRSACVLTDETGFAPSSYDPHSWRVLGHGNFSQLEGAYADMRIREHWYAHTEPRDKLHNASVRWREEMRAFFDGSASLPFVFGYGTPLREAGARGVMLTAWRHTRA